MATFTVTNTNNSGAGSLRQEILDANALSGKDIINFGGLFDDGLAHTISLIGGGLSITDDIAIQGTNPNLLTITDNSASRVFDITSGATATINGLTITNSFNTFNDYNIGVIGGGAISNEGVLSLSNSIITGNAVNGGDGGGIYNSGTLAVNYSTISDNYSYDNANSTGNGGGIYNSGTLTLNYSRITNNSAIGDSFRDNFSRSGGGIYNSGTLTINGSNISNNNSGYSGGGIENTGSLTVNYSNITDNAAIGGGPGGGIDIYGSYGHVTLTTINYSTISGNKATVGAGIYNIGFNFPTPNGTIAGTIYGNLSINNSTISYNYATTGGGIYNNGTLSLSDSTISSNYASLYGGGIYNSSSNGNGNGSDSNNQFGLVTVSYSSISGNTAGKAGGGIYNNANDGGSFYTSSYSSNTVRGDQLGIVTVSDSTISNNQAHFGGGIYNDGTLTVGNSIIKHNKAFGIELSSGSYESGDGGGIYNNSTYGTTTIDYSAIACNFDTCQEDSNNRIQPDDIAGKFINKGYNWVGINTATTAAGDAA
ncbi:MULTISPECIES: hypothetical protein [unclassified Nostoc]|uniref:beta strand repeat-containing protein n=1 Tax=unclassified Nostoc TaxID=2593658 RepID=UPI002AD40D66|nr:hypothetical protein [Nostoc sp. DedQUE03]MDZ7972176.1 hypothetical protein [Nostoc sp. DedQUE03]MDZ8047167.1 hypothetical protein [Nostoc sp. DedQUE02]